MERSELNQRLPRVVDAIVKSVEAHPRMQHLNRIYLPSRDAIVHILHELRELMYPGYFGKQGLTTENLPYRLGECLIELTDALFEQISGCIRYREQVPAKDANDDALDNSDEEATRIVSSFFDTIPAIRELLASDVQAAFDGDPAAKTTDETIFCYPGLFAITVQRIAHEFYKMNVPLLPRIMTEHAHTITGIDIHPGAQLGRSFFIDHGTGVVIGETTVIGERVKIYQGVTLGAIAPAYGQYLRGQKRHPTIEDDVTIYAGATILGGETVIGAGSVIGGNVFITSSVPPQNQVVAEPPKLRFRDRRPKTKTEMILDFQI